MKKLLGILVFTFSFLFVSAQNWDSLGNGIIDYSPGGAFGGVYSQAQFGNNLYVAGAFNYAGRRMSKSIAEWNGTIWSAFDSGFNGVVNALCVYNGFLYAGGYFDSVGELPVKSIAAWNGTTWSALDSGLHGSVNAMCVFNSLLYVGGYLDSSGTLSNNIAVWNGTSWASVGSGIPFKANTSYIAALCVYNGELYAGGSFDTAGGVPVSNIAKWNGTSWSAVGNGINQNGYIYSMAVFNGLLYVGGQFDSAGGNPNSNIAAWNGASWLSIGSGIPYNHRTNNYFVNSLCVFDSALCIGGYFDTAGGLPVNSIAYWNGANWGTFGSGITAGRVYSVYNFNSTLFAAGYFSIAGGIPVNNIAQWRSPLGIDNLSNDTGQVSVYPNPNNGTFQLQVKSEELRVKNVLEVYNVMGERVFTSTLAPPKEGDASFAFQINISRQSDGIYLYRVLSETGELTGEGKIVIER